MDTQETGAEMQPLDKFRDAITATAQAISQRIQPLATTQNIFTGAPRITAEESDRIKSLYYGDVIIPYGVEAYYVSWDAGHQVLKLYNFALDDRLRGQGLGDAIVTVDSINLAKSLGAKRFVISSFINEPWRQHLIDAFGFHSELFGTDAIYVDLE